MVADEIMQWAQQAPRDAVARVDLAGLAAGEEWRDADAECFVTRETPASTVCIRIRTPMTKRHLAAARTAAIEVAIIAEGGLSALGRDPRAAA